MRVHVCARLCSHACAVSARGHARACLRAEGSRRPVPTVWGGTPEGSWPGRGDRGPGPGPGSGQGRRRRPRWQGAFFPGRKRCEGGGQVGIVLEKNMNYLSVTSRLAWRGAAAERPERQVRAAPAQSDPGAASRRAAGGLPAREPPSPPWARKGACGGSACRAEAPKSHYRCLSRMMGAGRGAVGARCSSLPLGPALRAEGLGVTRQGRRSARLGRAGVGPELGGRAGGHG